MAALVEDQVARVCSTTSSQRSGQRTIACKKAEVDLPWKRRGPKTVDGRRGITSIFEAEPPKTRHARKLSLSKVGLGGASPHYARIRGLSPNRERSCKNRIETCLKKGTLEECWKIYIEASAWYQDDAPWPIQNSEFVKVRKRISKLLKEQMQEALDSDDLESLESAEKAAMSKIEILGVQGNKKFPELEEISAKLDMMRAIEAGNVNKLENIIATARRSSSRSSITSIARRAEAEHAKVSARAGLDKAMRNSDIDALRASIADCFKHGVDEKVVVRTMRHIRVKSKYYEGEFVPPPRVAGEASEDDGTGSAELGTTSTNSLDSMGGTSRGPSTRSFRRQASMRTVPLFAKNCFKDEERVFHLVNLGPDIDFNTLQRSVQFCGLAFKLHEGVEAIMKTPEVWKNPQKHTIWIVSGSEPAVLEKNVACVTKLADFNKAGGGLGVIASGTRGRAEYNMPLVKDANLLLAKLGLAQLAGNFEGRQTLEPFLAEGSSGMNTTHAVFEHISHLSEGWTLTEVNEELLRQGFTELVRASTGTLLSAIREPSEGASNGAGPLLVHGSATQLACTKDGIGQEAFLGNLACYTCLRSKDVYEVFDLKGSGFEVEIVHDSF